VKDDPKPADDPVAVSTPQTYKVKKGDTLGKIANAHYGDDRYAEDIRKANGMTSDKILADQVLKLPKIDTTPPTAPTPIKSAVNAKESGKGLEVDKSGPNKIEKVLPSVPKTYTIQPGDNLVTISRKFYNDVKHVKAIENLNRGVIKNMNKLPAGVTIKLP